VSEGWGWLQGPPDLQGMEVEAQASDHRGRVPSFLYCPCPLVLQVPSVPLVPLVHLVPSLVH